MTADAELRDAPGPMTPAAVPGRGPAARDRATPGRSSSSRSRATRLALAPGPVHDALRLRRRRGADLGQRRPAGGPLVHTVRAVGAVTAGDLRRAAGRRARRARPVRERVAGRGGRRGGRRRRRRRHRARAAAPGRAAGPRPARRVRRRRRCSTAPHARQTCSTRPSSQRLRGRVDLEVDVTVDTRRRRLARARSASCRSSSARRAFDPGGDGRVRLRAGDHDALRGARAARARAWPPSGSTSRWSATCAAGSATAATASSARR